MKLGHHELTVLLTRRAETRIQQLSSPLHIELELYFSCLIKKQVKFLTAPQHDTYVHGKLTPQVSVGYRPVQTKTCRVESFDDPTPLEVFPIARPEPFMPCWVVVDFRDGGWLASWGYGAEKPALHAV